MVARCVLGCALLAAAPAWATPEPKPGPATHLLAAPKLASAARTFVAFAGEPAAIKVAWTPVIGAVQYRARWSNATQTVDVMLTAPAFERREASAGQHLLSVVAIDAGGIESAPADLAIEVVTIAALAPGAKTATAAPLGAYAVGSAFSSPGVRCQLGAETPAMEVVARSPGAYRLRCGGEAGEPIVEVPVVIVPIVVRGDLAPVARETTTKIHLTIASIGTIGDHLEIAALGDLDLGPAERVAGGIDIPITPSATATTAGLIVRANRLELGRIPIELVDAPKPAPVIEPESEWFALDLGAQVGGFLPPDVGASASSLGHPIDPGDTIGSGPLVGIRIGMFPTPRVGLEIESAIAFPSYQSRLGVAGLLLNRGQLAVRIVEDGRFGLRGLLGGDLLTTTMSAGTSKVGTLGGLHYGAAFSIETRPGVTVRIEALDVITIAQDAGYAHCLELQIGVVTRLGRRDRWK